MNAIVIGGGPAGLSSAIGLARAGFSVKILEQRKEWTGRVCGAFLSPEASSHLNWLGVLEKVREKSSPCRRVFISRSGGGTYSVPVERNGSAVLPFREKSWKRSFWKRPGRRELRFDGRSGSAMFPAKKTVPGSSGLAGLNRAGRKISVAMRWFRRTGAFLIFAAANPFAIGNQKKAGLAQTLSLRTFRNLRESFPFTFFPKATSAP
jgi:hypothetical protein